MICTKCGKELDFISPVLKNVAAYGGYVTGVSSCCGTAYRIGRIIEFDVQLYEGDKTEDDWGNKISKLNI